MNLTVPEAVSLAGAVVESASHRRDVDVVVCPSYTMLHAVNGVTRSSAVGLGGQDVFWKESGAFTGQVSARMLADAGCSHCIVGHSEKRGRFGAGDAADAAYFSDTDESISKKLPALSYVGIIPILCVGETFDERQRGDTEGVIMGQLAGALGAMADEEVERICAAYEPVWAIGTGKVCDAAEADRICGLIREEVRRLASADIRVLYGGSVKSDNCAELFAQQHIDGALVGGASLIADEFARIILAA